MLQSNISDFPPWNKEYELNGKFLLFEDCLSMCEDFTLSYFLLKVLKQNKCVNILSLNHGKSHYESLLRKSGIDFALYESNDRIIVHDLNLVKNLNVMDISEETIKVEEDIFISVSVVQTEPRGPKISVEDEITELVKSGVLTSSVVIIDDLEALEVSCSTPKAARGVLNFLQDLLYCRKIHALAVFGREAGLEYLSRTADPSDPVCLRGVPLAQRRSIHFPALSEVCKYRADVVVVARPLGTGYAGDVHGNVSVAIGLFRTEYLFRTTTDGDVFCCKLGS